MSKFYTSSTLSIIQAKPPALRPRVTYPRLHVLSRRDSRITFLWSHRSWNVALMPLIVRLILTWNPIKVSFDETPTAEFILPFNPSWMLGTFKSYSLSLTSAPIVESESKMVRWYRSTCSFPRGIAVAFKCWVIPRSSQYSTNDLLVNAVPRSEIRRRGTPKILMIFWNNLITSRDFVDLTGWINIILVINMNCMKRDWQLSNRIQESRFLSSSRFKESTIQTIPYIFPYKPCHVLKSIAACY